ncbi:MAG TPA: hypothetical protein DEA55_03255 [Rhodospirillaceae bacterium]|nr:hypothetical protein [Rhodospirillaceae bacterium]
MSLILGAVQFGMEYGVTNKSGKPASAAAFNALDTAWDAGIHVLDSAQGYGQANRLIAEYHAERPQRFSIINKVMREPETPEEVVSSLRREREEMDIHKFSCVMLHYAPSVRPDLPGRFLDDLKSSGITEHVGISIETPADYEKLKDRFRFDIVQLPLNFLSQEFISDDFLRDLKEDGVEIHARSAFLQGLTIANPREIPDYLSGLAPSIREFHEDCAETGISPLTGSLMFLEQKSFIEHIVVGAQDSRQMKEIVTAYDMARDVLRQGKNLSWGKYAIRDFKLAHPSCWGELRKGG